MKSVFKKVAVFLLLLMLGYGIYIVYLSFYPYLANGSIAAKRIAEKSVVEDVDLCSKIKNWPFPFNYGLIDGEFYTENTFKVHCYLELAELTGDLNLCETAQMHYARPDSLIDYCYTTIAMELGDVRICDRISDSSSVTKGRCYTTFATRQNDMSICNKISDTTKREQCKNYVRELPINNL